MSLTEQQSEKRRKLLASYGFYAEEPSGYTNPTEETRYCHASDLVTIVCTEMLDEFYLLDEDGTLLTWMMKATLFA